MTFVIFARLIILEYCCVSNAVVAERRELTLFEKQTFSRRPLFRSGIIVPQEHPFAQIRHSTCCLVFAVFLFCVWFLGANVLTKKQEDPKTKIHHNIHQQNPRFSGKLFVQIPLREEDPQHNFACDSSLLRFSWRNGLQMHARGAKNPPREMRSTRIAWITNIDF